jgi:hypothetical protein
MKQTKETKPAAPAVTIEARENQMIALAVDEAERRIKGGKASDSLLIHYLKLGTTRNQLEKAKLEKETALAQAKVDSIKQAEQTEERYKEAIRAMTIYTGNGEEEDYND